ADITDNVNLITGTDYYRDTAEARNTFNSKFGKNKDQKSISYDNFAAFAQGVYKTEFANITLGGRFENHSEYGSSFVPRTAITTFLGDFHGKLLFSKAFKVPTIENINLFRPTDPKQTKIRPEDATVMELETGYKLTDNMFITANLFDININQPIVYYYDEKDFDSYANFDKIGTRGIELEYKFKDTKWGFANLAYSFYGVSDNKVERAAIPNVPNQLLAYPSHKVSLNSSLNVTRDFSINPSAIFYGDRYGAGSLDKDGNVVMKKYDPTIMLNLVLSHKNFLAKGLTLDLGAYNILNQAYQYILPYNSTYAPFQGPTNDFSLNLRYDFPLGDS
ncbi:MAG: TonB-dependent receptor plug domain-containing protein, partial [Candidatus Sericytochromatia bacterium]